MSMEKIIKSFGEFVLDEQVYFYEQKEVDGVVESRKLSPTFAFENWEIYVLPLCGEFLYAIVGLHGGKRVFYADDSEICSYCRYFASAGRDLICNIISYREVFLLQPKDGMLKNATSSLKSGSSVYTHISSLEYVNGVLIVSLQVPPVSSEKKFFLQTKDGYQEITKINAEQIIKDITSTPSHLLFR